MNPESYTKSLNDEGTDGTLYAEDIGHYDIYDGCVIGFPVLSFTINGTKGKWIEKEKTCFCLGKQLSMILF